ncbi:MAG: hypothetical protein A3I66_08080 [Burkholderiales bacterium RIFCSPLOWO2_02_FULL_57_36]|nr:MAG: hypothetical protein A3I66_08080 [Burkholderiales bacterium RIFCSPLOWO2_02_FULL_57_36]
MLPGKFIGRTRRCRELFIERLTIPDATPEKSRPLRYDRRNSRWLGQQAPHRRMMPAEVLLRAVAMLADGIAEFDHFRNEFIARQVIEVRIHEIL